MQSKKFYFGSALVAVLITTAIVAGTASAFNGNMFNRGFSEEQKEKVAEMKQLRKSGDHEAVERLRKELGVRAHGFEGMEKPNKFMGDSENQEAIREAIESSDYQAWLALVGEDCKMAQYITEDNFAEFAAAHMLIYEGKDLMKEGKEQIREIIEAAKK